MARRRQRSQGPPSVRPFDVDGVRTVAIGTVLWAIAFVVLALFREELDQQGMGWWLWTCLAGVGLGLLGLEYTRKRRDAIARARLDEEANIPDDLDAVPASDDADLTARPDEGVPAETEEWRPEPEPHAAEAKPAAAADAQVESGRFEVEPPASATSSRRARRASRTLDQSTRDLAEPLLPAANRDLDQVADRPAGGRRARRGSKPDEDEISDGGTGYRGRRARRP